MPNQYNQILPGQQYVSQFVPLPFDEINQTLAARQGQYNQGEANRQAIEDQFLKVQALNPDIQKRNQLIKGYKESISKKLSEVGGDYSQLDPFIKEQARKIKEDLAYGQLGAIQQNYGLAQAHLKNLDERHDEFLKTGKGLDSEQYRLLKQNALRNYQGIGEVDEFGAYNKFQAENPVAFQNINEKALQLAKNIPLHKWAADSGWGQDKNGNWRHNNGTGEYVTEKEIRDKITPLLATDPENQSYIRQMAKLRYTGEDYIPSIDKSGNKIAYEPNYYHLQKPFEDAADLAAKYYAQNNTIKKDSDLKFDAGYEARAKAVVENPDIYTDVITQIATAPQGKKVSVSPTQTEGLFNKVNGETVADLGSGVLQFGNNSPLGKLSIEQQKLIPITSKVADINKQINVLKGYNPNERKADLTKSNLPITKSGISVEAQNRIEQLEKSKQAILTNAKTTEDQIKNINNVYSKLTPEQQDAFSKFTQIYESLSTQPINLQEKDNAIWVDNRPQLGVNAKVTLAALEAGGLTEKDIEELNEIQPGLIVPSGKSAKTGEEGETSPEYEVKMWIPHNVGPESQANFNKGLGIKTTQSNVENLDNTLRSINAEQSFQNIVKDNGLDQINQDLNSLSKNKNILNNQIILNGKSMDASTAINGLNEELKEAVQKQDHTTIVIVKQLLDDLKSQLQK